MMSVGEEEWKTFIVVLHHNQCMDIAIGVLISPKTA